MTRCLLHDKGLPEKSWAGAGNISVFLLNKFPTKALQKKTSFETWFGYKPFLTNLQIFCFLCYTYIPQVKKDKLDNKAERGIFVGCSSLSKAYRIYQPQNDKIIVYMDVKFMENDTWSWKDGEKEKNLESLDEVVGYVLVRGTIVLSNIYQR